MTDLCPPPGIYPGVDFETYRNWPAVNHSKLMRIDKSPLHTQVMPDISDKDAIRFGQLVHSGTLEPGSVAQRYAVEPAFQNDPENQTADGKQSTSASTTYVKNKKAAFDRIVQATGKIVVTQKEYDKYLGVVRAISENIIVSEMIERGECELSIVWDDTETGIRCKARIDCKTSTRLMDLKTSRDDSNKPLPELFNWSLGNYSYHTQAAWYQSGWQALTGERLPFWFAVVSTSEPYQCIAAVVGEMSLSLGREINRKRLAAYSECHRAGRFPGYESPVLFELPEKYFSDELFGGAT